MDKYFSQLVPKIKYRKNYWLHPLETEPPHSYHGTDGTLYHCLHHRDNGPVLSLTLLHCLYRLHVETVHKFESQIYIAFISFCCFYLHIIYTTKILLVLNMRSYMCYQELNQKNTEFIFIEQKHKISKQSEKPSNRKMTMIINQGIMSNCIKNKNPPQS